MEVQPEIGFYPQHFKQHSLSGHLRENSVNNVFYAVCYRPESKPRQEASHLERMLHLDMVCRHRNQLIDRTKNVYCLKSNNNSSLEADLDDRTFHM